MYNIPDMQMEALLPPGQKYFMTADIKCGFWNIKVRKEDQHKLAIQWKGNNYMFQRLPFPLLSLFLKIMHSFEMNQLDKVEWLGSCGNMELSYN